jgi:rfaE bifunctional protein nucleotidyltransferase chain/domain|tara:strand:+ start:3060 stop:3536 length:477 start_codon:yes stop_codon:yes gene_type:complete
MNNNKEININDLLKNLSKLRKKKNIIIGFANGCFDLLHKGHLSLLTESKKKCDYLIIGLNSDKSIKLLKGKSRPIENETKRVSMLTKQKEVDAIIIFEELTPLNLIINIKPNILFKGSDYLEKKIIGSNFIYQNGGKIELIDILDGYSTTNLIKNFNS